MHAILRVDYLEDEVKCALSQMHPIKAPSLDRRCPMFFKSYWHIMGPSLMQTILSILRGNHIPCHLNRTCITLIPKKE